MIPMSASFSSASSSSHRSSSRWGSRSRQARTDADRYAMNPQRFRTNKDPPSEASIQLSQRQLELKKQRKAEKAEKLNKSSRGRSQSERRIDAAAARKPTHRSMNETMQQPFQTRSNLERKQKDPPTCASSVGARSASTPRLGAPPVEEKELESQRAILRSLIGSKGSRRNIGNPPGRKDPPITTITKTGLKEKLRQRIFTRDRSKSPAKTRSTKVSRREPKVPSSNPTKKTASAHSEVSQSPRSLLHDRARSIASSSSSKLVLDEKFNQFASDLGSEVMGCHSQLAASFRSCITGKDSKVDRAQKRHLKPESVKILHAMNEHLQDLAPRMGKTQMVTDRVYQKETGGRSMPISRVESSRRDSIAEDASKRPSPRNTSPDAAETSTHTITTVASASAEDTTANATPRLEASNTPSIKRTPLEPRKQTTDSKSKQTPPGGSLHSNLSSTAKIPDTMERWRVPSSVMKSTSQPVVDPDLNPSLVERAHQAHQDDAPSRDLPTSSTKPVQSIPSPSQIEPSQPTPVRPWLRQLNPVARQMPLEEPCSELKLTPPRLRRVEVPKTAAPQKSVPWANISLKPVKRDVRPPVEPIAENSPVPQSKPAPVIISVEDVEPTSEPGPIVISVVDELMGATDSSEPSAEGTAPEPLELYDEDEESDPEVLAVIVLKQNTSCTTKQSKVILGKRYIRKIQQNVGESHGVVQWKILRDKLENDGMTLNMQSLKVGLLLKEGENKELCFGNSEDCLRFATSFYNASLAPPNDMIETASISSSVKMESLNDEEQSVLEKYRELRLSKAHEEAIRETITPGIPKSSTLTTTTGLTADEESTATKYRNMLKKSLPIGAVKHQMAVEGASAKVVDVIVLEAESMAPPTTVSTGELPSSPVSTFTVTSVGLKSHDSELTEEEEKAVIGYTMMLKRGVPPDAVRHKLSKDEASMKVVTAVFCQEEPPTVSPVDTESNLSTTEQMAVKRYSTMLKTGVPREAVRHQAARDQMSTKVLAAVFGKESDPEKSEPSVSLSAAEEAIASKYRKMLKMGVPADAVQQKMIQEEVDTKLIEAVVGSCHRSTHSVNAKPERGQSSKKPSTLTEAEESLAADYRKLLKRQVPRDALQFRMVKEGVSEKVIMAVLGKSAMTDSCDQSKHSGSASTASNMINYHWRPIRKVQAGSVWTINDDAPDTDRCDFAQLLEKFQKKPTGSKRLPLKTDASNSTGKAKLLDLTRSNNVAISLKSFKEFDYRELANILAFLDPCRKIRGERAQFLRDLLPTVAEVRIIAEYQGSDDRLVPGELWFRRLRGIRRLENKARVIRTMEMFSSDASEIRGNFRMLGLVCKQVVESKKLQDVLKMVLQIGNVMNEGTRMGGASGFKLDSLLRLTQTKTADGKMTLLDYLVTLFVERNDGNTLEMISDFPELHTACRLLINDMKNEVKILADALAECKRELSDLERDESKTIENEPAEKPTSGVGDPRAQLFATITARSASAGDSKPSGFQKREQFLAAMEEKKKIDQSDNETRKPASQIENNITGGITRLRNFIDSVEDSFSRLETQRNDALSACRELSTYCGESGGIASTTTLLDILSQFVRNVESSHKKHNETQKRLAAKARKSNSMPKAATTKQTVVSAVNQEKSIVLMVNDVLRNANPVFKEDFKKGRILHDPSETLKAIYEKEKQLLRSSPAANIDHHGELDRSRQPSTPPESLVPETCGDESPENNKLNMCDAGCAVGGPENPNGDVNSQPCGDDGKSVDEVRLALEEISRITSIAESHPKSQVGTTLSERARDKRQQKGSQSRDPSSDVSKPEHNEPAFESATARSARKKRLQMRMAR